MTHLDENQNMYFILTRDSTYMYRMLYICDSVYVLYTCDTYIHVYKLYSIKGLYILLSWREGGESPNRISIENCGTQSMYSTCQPIPKIWLTVLNTVRNKYSHEDGLQQDLMYDMKFTSICAYYYIHKSICDMAGIILSFF
jgi:hypothetical protein